MPTTLFVDQFCHVTKSGDCPLNEDFVKFGLTDIKVKKNLSILPYFWLPIGTKHRNLEIFFPVMDTKKPTQIIFTFKKFIIPPRKVLYNKWQGEKLLYLKFDQQ
jgi:hypothetical protein